MSGAFELCGKDNLPDKMDQLLGRLAVGIVGADQRGLGVFDFPDGDED